MSACCYEPYYPINPYSPPAPILYPPIITIDC